MHRPSWELFVDTTDSSIQWIDHAPNRRFAVHTAGTNTPADDVVWDKETGLIWPRSASLLGASVNWLDASTKAREFRFASRIGWRLPTVEELSSLFDTRRSNPALPTGHPFVAVQSGSGVPAYWTSTNHESAITGAAWFVDPSAGAAGLANKSTPGFIWPVRAARGGVSWT